MTLLFQTQNPKKEYIISLSFSLGVCVCVCMCVSFLLFWYMILSLSLSGQNNERGYDDSFVDVKSVEDLGIAENGSFFGLKSSRSGFYFLIFPIRLLRKWERRVHFLVWNLVDLAFIFWFFYLSYLVLHFSFILALLLPFSFWVLDWNLEFPLLSSF